ncbi:MAG TPA: four helix bundle suffix domain-containing protein, partial [Opitutales bacterium]|nr:four helix bundle suffix domain-containing protein [Opitutales bacterium]
HDLPLWSKDSPEARQVRALGRQIQDAPAGSSLADPQDPGDRARNQLYADWLQHKDPTIIANTLLCLIHQANYLLDQQLIGMEQDFIEGGGYSEQLATARIAARRRKDQSDRTDPSDQSNPQPPKCPQCGELMALRTARQGNNQGSQFWGCAKYPDCKGTAPLE